MHRDLRDWVEGARKLGVLKDVQGADWNLEIGAITDLNVKHKKHVLLFDRITGYPEGHQVLTGSLLDSRRVAFALGLDPNLGNLDLVKILREKVAKAIASAGEFPIHTEADAPLFENTQRGADVDLFSLPAPKWFSDDGGRYLGTADTVVTRDPDSAWINVATYRVMVHDRCTLAIFMEASRHGRMQMQKYFDRGQPCPVAISFGHHPALFVLAGTEVPQGLSEYNVLGGMTGEPYRTVKGPVTGLPIPADSEIAIEGYIHNEPRDEGPFGEFMGYYAGGKAPAPVVKVEALYNRNNPILLGTCAGRPPYDYSYFRCPMRAALIWDILERAGIANVAGVWCHEAGFSRAFTVVSIKQAFAGHARQAGYVACQCRPGAVSGRYVVVVDEDIDPSNLNEVIWAMCSRSDPATTIDLIRESLGTPIDPIADREDGKSILEYTSSRAIIIACKPFGMLNRGQFPRVVEADKKLNERVRKEFLDLFA